MKPYFLILLLLVQLSLSAQLTSSFTPNKYESCGPSPIQFTASRSSTGYTSFLWDFGNGQTNNTEIDPLVLFQPGTYTVKLTVYNGNTSNSSSKTIAVYEKPDGKIVVEDKNYGCIGDELSFSANITKGNEANMTINWIFGDGIKSTGTSVSHTYNSENVSGFPLVMELVDEHKCSAKIYEPISISSPPELSISSTSAGLCSVSKMKLELDITSKADINYILWDINGKYVSGYDSLTYLFPDFKTYPVSVVVRDKNKCSSKISTQVKVTGFKPQITLENGVCVLQEIEFDPGVDAADHIQWYFEDGTTSSQLRPTKFFTQADTSFRIILTADKDDCAGTDTSYISISSAYALIDEDTIVKCDFPNEVQITNKSTGDITGYRWDYRNDNIANTFDFDEEVEDSGYIYLEINGENACISYDSVYVKLEHPNPVITIPETAGCIPFTIEYSYDSSTTLSPVEECTFTWTKNNTSDTYTKVTTDYLTLSITDPQCKSPYSTTVEIHAGDDPQISINLFDTLYAWHLNHFDMDSPIADSIDYAEWVIDTTTIYDTAIDYRLYIDTLYVQDSVPIRIFDYKKPGEIVDIKFTAAYNGCGDSIKTTRIVQGPLIIMDEPHYLSCEEPLINIFPYHLYDGNTCRLQLQEVVPPGTLGDIVVDTIIDYEKDTTLRDSLVLKLDPGFYRIKYGASNLRNGKSYMITMIDWELVELIPVKKPVIFPVSDTVHAEFIMIDKSACWNEPVYIDASLSKNAVVYEWFKYHNIENKNRLSKLYYCPSDFSNPLIGQANPNLISLLQLSNHGAECEYDASLINTSYTNVLFCEKGMHGVMLVATATNGCRDEMHLDSIIRIFKPEATLTVENEDICDGDAAIFKIKNLDADTLLNHIQLQTGKEDDYITITDTSKTYSVVYYDGAYYPHILVSNTEGCETEFPTLTINAHLPKPQLSIPEAACINSNVSISLVNTFSTYSWDYGDGNQVANGNQRTVHLYSNPGNYTVGIDVTDQYNCPESTNAEIEIVEEPSLKLDFNASTYYCPIFILEAYDSINNKYINSRTWDFENTSIDEEVQPISSSLANAVIPLLYPGVYDMEYTIESDVCGIYDTTYKQVFNLGGPYMRMMPLEKVYCLEDNIALHIDSTTLWNNPIFTKWSIENKTEIVEQFTTHTAYTIAEEAGWYMTKLFYTDTLLCEGVDSVSFNISKFTADFDLDSNVCEMPHPLIVSYPDYFESLGYRWVFNGTNTYNQDLYELVTSEGKYEVQLVATSPEGCQYEKIKEIWIKQPPEADISVPNIAICPGESIQLTNIFSEKYLYNWSPGSSLSNSIINNPVAQPDGNTTYILQVTDTTNDCVSNDTITIFIQEKPAFNLLYRYDSTEWLNKEEVINAPFGETLYITFSGNQPDLTGNWTSTGMELECLGITSDNSNCNNVSTLIINSSTIGIIVSDSLQCFEVSDNFNITTKLPKIVMPTAFSPNDDGHNDKVGVKGTGIYRIESFKIFNQLGTLVFETGNVSDEWDGTQHGKPVPPGVYFYFIQAKAFNTDIDVTLKGEIKLIR